ncbi:hypothetical protein FLONG3_7874 [Fusarium longipes]|uniref:Uncharacterized protein n=1 Tax=Fusarium longipes TaxID=694270 RepID=A0A395SA23_9HYPO|nr:hypothetical protein FLONG3_7874 [Fusarium longipes]
MPESTARSLIPPPYNKKLPGVKASFLRIYVASGVWPWDLVPECCPSTWSYGATRKFAEVVEEVSEPNSNITLAQLQEFLRQMAKTTTDGVVTYRILWKTPGWLRGLRNRRQTDQDSPRKSDSSLIAARKRSSTAALGSDHNSTSSKRKLQELSSGNLEEHPGCPRETHDDANVSNDITHVDEMKLRQESLRNLCQRYEKVAAEINSAKEAATTIGLDLDKLAVAATTASHDLGIAKATLDQKQDALSHLQDTIGSWGDQFPPSMNDVIKDMKAAISSSVLAVNAAESREADMKKRLEVALENQKKHEETKIILQQIVDTLRQDIDEAERHYDTYRFMTKVKEVGFDGLKAVPHKQLTAILETLDRHGQADRPGAAGGFCV